MVAAARQLHSSMGVREQEAILVHSSSAFSSPNTDSCCVVPDLGHPRPDRYSNRSSTGARAFF